MSAYVTQKKWMYIYVSQEKGVLRISVRINIYTSVRI